MRAARTRTLSVGTTPVNIRKTPAYPNDPEAYPVTYATLRYAAGGANIAILSSPFATGSLTFATNPVDTETIDVNGVTYTFTPTGATATDVAIGTTKADTCANLAAKLSMSANTLLVVAKYIANQQGNPNVLNITSLTPGTGGNSFTLANSSSAAVTRSAATLTGGQAYADGEPIDAAADFNDVDQSFQRYIVADATGPTSVLVTDMRA